MTKVRKRPMSDDQRKARNKRKALSRRRRGKRTGGA